MQKIVKFKFFLILFLISATCRGQNDPVGARPAGMANAVLNSTDIWSAFHNQAGLARLEHFSAGAFYENKFLISELAYTGIGLASPLGAGTIGLTYTNLGFSVYSESKLGLSYALKLSERFSIGVQANYHNTVIQTEDYGSTNTFTAEIGFRHQVSDKVSLAAHIFNPTRSQLNEYNDERLPTIIRFGAQYDISEELIVTGEVEKDIDEAALLRAGLEYRPVNVLYIRLGASSQPSLFAFGLGINMGQFQFDLASTYHSVLGYSPQVSLSFLPGSE